MKIRSSVPWLAAVLVAALVGFLVRSAFVLRGHASLNSDEVLYYHYFQSLADSTNPSDDLFQWKLLRGFRWLAYGFYLACGQREDAIPFFACFMNVVLYLLWMAVVARRTDRWGALVPLLVFLVLPSPAVSYSGTGLSEWRYSYFYGAILIWLAGSWLKSRWSCFCFGFFAAFGCWEDPFTLFFVLPVFWFERECWISRNGLVRIQKALTVLLGAAFVSLLCFRNSLWNQMVQENYLHPGLGSLDEWSRHFKMMIQAWPAYWMGGIPWGYLQNSRLGLCLSPAVGAAKSPWMAFTFWVLLIVTFWGSAIFLRKKRGGEIWLWLVPPVLFLAFFVFSAQSWDALTLRYLGFWQLVPALCLSSWPSFSRWTWKGKMGLAVLISWACLHFFMGTLLFRNTSPEHAAQRIATRLEEKGYRAGFANYWVSEPVRYFSHEKILLAPYNHSPLSRKASFAAQNSEKIALVLVEGLDRADQIPEVEKQLKDLGYRRISTTSFELEGWSVANWEKKPLGKKK